MLDGYSAATMNFQTWSQIAFAFRVTPKLLLDAIILASIVGLFGGILPAIRAVRQPIATGLRARYIAEPLVMRDGKAIAPERAGHGVAFDWTALEKLRS